MPEPFSGFRSILQTNQGGKGTNFEEKPSYQFEKSQ